MKKIRTLGIITMAALVLSVAVFAVLAAFGILKIEENAEGENIIIFTPAKEENPAPWKDPEFSGIATVTLRTDYGEIGIKIADSEAGKKFLELCESESLIESEFKTLAENMFIQAEVSGESFSCPKTEFACTDLAVGFVTEGKKTYPSIVIITAKELSGSSSAFLEKSSFSDEKNKAYKKFGGVPEYEGKITVFGGVCYGTENVRNIAKGENSGYTGGYSALSPVKINSAEISYHGEKSE